MPQCEDDELKMELEHKESMRLLDASMTCPYCGYRGQGRSIRERQNDRIQHVKDKHERPFTIS